MLQRRQPWLALKCLIGAPPFFSPLRFSSPQTWWVEKGGKGSIDTLLFLFLFFRFRRVKNTSQTIREAANVLHHFSWASSFSFFSSFHKAGDGVQLSKTSPPHLAWSHAISSQMTGWELAGGALELWGMVPVPHPPENKTTWDFAQTEPKHEGTSSESFANALAFKAPVWPDDSGHHGDAEKGLKRPRAQQLPFCYCPCRYFVSWFLHGLPMVETAGPASLPAPGCPFPEPGTFLFFSPGSLQT